MHKEKKLEAANKPQPIISDKVLDMLCPRDSKEVKDFNSKYGPLFEALGIN